MIQEAHFEVMPSAVLRETDFDDAVCRRDSLSTFLKAERAHEDASRRTRVLNGVGQAPEASLTLL